MPLMLEAVREKEAEATTRFNRPEAEGSSSQYLPVERLREQYLNYLMSKQPEIEEQKLSRRYYHGAQYSSEDIRILRDRRQPIITYNRVGRKINTIVGLIERLHAEPKALPRKPQNQGGADVASTTIRTVLDGSDWRTLEEECIRHGGIDGISGIELKLVEGDQDDPDIEVAQVFGDDYFYDPRSYKYDFSDSRYEGIGKWVDIEEAIELFPDKEDLLRGLIQAGSDLTTRADREFKWVMSTEQQLRLVEHWYRYKGKWCWAFYVSNVLLDEGVSPFRDARGKSSRRYYMFSAAIDHDGDRYGFVRNLKGPQDEVNQRRSKGLHLSNTRRLKIEKGAVDDVEKTRREWARPDGVLEVNPGRMGGVIADDTTQEIAAQQAWFEDAKREIDDFAQTSVASMVSGQAFGNLSGRAIELLQAPGMAELGPFILAIRSWRLRVFKAVFCAAQQHWTQERWLRTADDDGLAQFMQVNGMDLDEFGRPMLVNALGALDVDIVLDEGRDVATMMQDTYEFVKNDPSVPVPVKIELAPIQGATKKKILKMLEPPPLPPPDPLDVMAKELAVASMAAEVENITAQAKERAASVIQKRASAVKDVFSAAQAAVKGGLPGGPAASIGVQSAPITPAPVDQGQYMPQPAPMAPPMPPPIDAMPQNFPPPQGF